MIVRYSVVGKQSAAYLAWLLGVVLLVVLGVYAGHYIDTNGHHVTGMNNRVVWGLPHVFAIFLIVTASGALNVASMASVFGKTAYRPLSRLSALVAIALLIGGLSVLVLDLGRPERLIVAITTYNFKSIFAWNIFLYSGFIVIVIVYLWFLFERRFDHYAKPIGVFAFVWRIVLTSGTGSIFGFLVAREAYDAALLAPLFVAMSLSFGTAVLVLIVAAICRFSHRPLDTAYLQRLGSLLGIFVAAVLYLTLVSHLSNLYAAEHTGVERFILFDGGVYTALFWGVQVLVGGIVPLLLIFSRLARRYPRRVTIVASVLVLIGAFAQLYVIIIAGQAYPLNLFPGKEVSGGFLDVGIAAYTPSTAELLLGFGGVAVAVAILSIGVRVLPFVPEQLRHPE